ncbi:contactin-4-like [Physella acuta]|uniref:contactin-4-like n=1 Tax=Physella acuta TaxID=109671 RepID=UPI0027DD1E6C|nr:contactin-4-like [Physella acuta]
MAMSKVPAAPSFGAVSDDTIKCLEGDSVFIRCQAVGFPQPTVTWYHEDGVLLPGNRHEISGNGLLIKSFKKEDFGSYSCVVANEEGEDVKAFTVEREDLKKDGARDSLEKADNVKIFSSYNNCKGPVFSGSGNTYTITQPNERKQSKDTSPSSHHEKSKNSSSNDVQIAKTKAKVVVAFFYGVIMLAALSLGTLYAIY